MDFNRPKDFFERMNSFFMVFGQQKAADIKIWFLWCFDLWKMTFCLEKKVVKRVNKRLPLCLQKAGMLLHKVDILLTFCLAMCARSIVHQKLIISGSFNIFCQQTKMHNVRESEKILSFVSSIILLHSYWDVGSMFGIRRNVWELSDKGLRIMSCRKFSEILFEFYCYDFKEVNICCRNLKFRNIEIKNLNRISFKNVTSVLTEHIWSNSFQIDFFPIISIEKMFHLILTLWLHVFHFDRMYLWSN